MADILDRIPVDDEMTIFKTQIEPIKLNACIDNILMRVDRLETKFADVQRVKHGRWIEKPPYKDETVKGLEFQIVCSECDEQNCSLEFDENYNAIGKTFYKTRYCPNCGAKMDIIYEDDKIRAIKVTG